MDRHWYTENMRRIRLQEQRDPVENALWALNALTPDQVATVADRYNGNQNRPITHRTARISVDILERIRND